MALCFVDVKRAPLSLKRNAVNCIQAKPKFPQMAILFSLSFPWLRNLSTTYLERELLLFVLLLR